MEAFWLSFAMIFIAELGDKTQLVALTLATRYNARVVLAGVFVATLAVHMVSVGLGGAAGKFLPTAWIHFTAGVAFIGFGFWTLRGDCLDEEDGLCKRRVTSPFWIVATTFFLAELGDKTMLSTVTLAATHSIVPVWIGSTLGMVLSDGLAILVGQVLGKRLPERAIKVGASCIFFAFGAFSMWQGGKLLPIAAWIGGVALLVLMYFLMFKANRQSATVAV
ncbi:MAG TPA: TMEM165/GDT1 family protein [Armatimonadota bacterium]|jgi:putative Ca2+/H+ antiporter (TMEM165/GDT1 family)